MSVEVREDAQTRVRGGEDAGQELRRGGVGVRTGVAQVVALGQLCEHGCGDLAGELSAGRQDTARAVGGAEALVCSGPGSWDASDLRPLACDDADFGW